MWYTSHFSSKRLPPNAVPIRVSRGFPRFKLRYSLTKKSMLLTPPPACLGLDDFEDFAFVYRAYLDALGTEAIREEIEELAGDRDVVFLCFENLDTGDRWCHRRIFAEWWGGHTGEAVSEL